MSEIRTLLPPTTAIAARQIEIVTAERTEGITHPIRDLWNPATCPAHLLPWLAWAFSVDLWQSDWSEAVKRQVIAESIAVHRIKGTVPAVKRGLAAIGLEIELLEWFEAAGVEISMGVHTFIAGFDLANIQDAGYQFDQALVDLITQQLDHLKPVRSHYHLEVTETTEFPISVRSGVLAVQENNDCFAPRVASYTQEMTCLVSCGVAASHIATQTLVFTGAPA